jgi:arylsulfatase A-like enzyme
MFPTQKMLFPFPYFLVLAFVLTTSWQSHSLRAVEPRTNVVLIVADDLGWADLGCYGSRFHRTPNLDRMAAEGMRFAQAYAACPVCSPSRAALMTGKWPARLHLTDWLPGRADRPDQKLLRPEIRQQLPLEETTLAEALHAEGYVTGHIGKWHLGGEGFEPQRQGFDRNIAGDHTGSPFSYFAPFHGRDRAGRVRQMPGLEQAPEAEYLTDRLTLEAEHFLEQNRERPFFLYLPHYTVHIPLRAKQEMIAKYPQTLTLGEQSNAIYAAMLESLDEGIGRLRRKLEELKLADRTLIIFTSDNGGLATLEGPNTPATINSPLREGKGYLYEGGVRVPLIVCWPGMGRTGVLSQTPVVGHDLFPTILAACGISQNYETDGMNLVPLLRDDSPPARDALYWHYPHYSNQGGRPGGAIREGKLKLIEFYENGRRELYDLANDVRESKNLAADLPQDVERLASRLDEWRRRIGAQTMQPNPAFVPNPQAADGTITLPARTADVHGVQLRFEPLPHKNTLGFWTNVDDWASWEFTVSKPGAFELEVWQGCGQGQGGSAVEFSVNGQTLPHSVVDTGHFQSFQPHVLGTIRLDKPGRMELSVHAKSKAKGAVMDVRQIVLRPVK